MTRIGNSWGLILPRDILDLLGVSEGEVELEVAGGALLVASPDTSPEELEGAFHYLLSRRERADVYRRLAE